MASAIFPRPHWPLFKGALHADGSPNRFITVVERRHDCVTHGFDHAASMMLNHGPQQVVVFGHHGKAGDIAKIFEVFGRTLYIRERAYASNCLYLRSRSARSSEANPRSNLRSGFLRKLLRILTQTFTTAGASQLQHLTCQVSHRPLTTTVRGLPALRGLIPASSAQPSIQHHLQAIA